MADSLHQIRIHADAPRIYQAITRGECLQDWWSADASCPHQEGALCRLNFDGQLPSLGLRAKKLLPHQRIYWICEEGPQEWLGTEIWWEITSLEQQQCEVSLKHMGWHTDTQEFASSNTRWGMLMHRLKQYCETGQALPPLAP